MTITSIAVAAPEYGNPWNEELGKAHAIQRHLLARDAGLIAHADCSAVCRQANAVAGKGLGAALLMANLQATLRAEARRVPSDLADVVASVNHLFHQACFEEGYATLFYATFDPETRVLKYLNA